MQAGALPKEPFFLQIVITNIQAERKIYACGVASPFLLSDQRGIESGVKVQARSGDSCPSRSNLLGSPRCDLTTYYPDVVNKAILLDAGMLVFAILILT